MWCLAVGVDGPFTVTTPDGATCHGHSLLIPPRLPHQLIFHGSGLVSCYLEPTSVRPTPAGTMSQWHGGIGVAHVDESRLESTPTR